MNQVQMPDNQTAWLRDNARKGAIIITDKYGIRRAFLGAKVTYTDPDTGKEQHPLFAPTDTFLGKRYTDTSAKAQLD